MTDNTPRLGKQLDDIMTRLSAAGTAWVTSGFGYDTPEYHAREAIFEELRAWNARVALHNTPAAPTE